jgi:NitT/TauT family transport system substrate-binding protein
MTPNRAALTLAAVAVLTGLTSCRPATSANGLVPVAFQTDWYPQPEHGGFYMALAKGYYKAEGLDVTILPGGPYVVGDTLVAAGKVQFAMNSSDHMLDAIANANEPVIAIAATMQHDPQGIMVHANSPVHTFADLNGQTVAVKPGSTWWEFIRTKFHLTSVHEIPATFSVANFIQDPNYNQQCFLTSEPYFAAKGGAPARVLLDRDAGYDPYRIIFTSTTYLHQHPDVVAKFVRASIHGWRDYMQDPTLANAMIEKLNPAMSPDWAAYSYRTLKAGNFITGDAPPSDGKPDQIGQLDPARWQTMYTQLLSLGVIKHPIDPRSAYTTQFTK